MTDMSRGGVLIRKVERRNLPMILAAIFAIVVVIQMVLQGLP